MELSKAAKEARNQYFREYRKRQKIENPEKLKESDRNKNRLYWERLAQVNQLKEQALKSGDVYKILNE